MVYRLLRQIMENPSVEGGKKPPCLEIGDAPVFRLSWCCGGFLLANHIARSTPLID